MKVWDAIGFLLWFVFISTNTCVGKDAYDVAVEKEFDECKELVRKALEKKGIKAGVKPAQATSLADKVTDDVDKLKLKP